MYLDHRSHILDVVLEGEGTIDRTAVYPREICKRALELQAAGFILAHNHPAGSLEPSENDKALTRQILTAARVLGMSVHDHLIVAHEGHFSFRQAGLI
jgi:DNA repair protein RadC